MKLGVNKIHVFFLAGLVALIGLGVVVAYGTSNPSQMGHSFGEVDGVQAEIALGMTTCAGANLAIKTINPATGAVTCETDDVGTGGGGTPSTSGTVVGWGRHGGVNSQCLENSGSCDYCIPGGSATCTGQNVLTCPSGSTRFTTLSSRDFSNNAPYFYRAICIKN